MTPHRLRAPAADGGLLADPPLIEAGPALTTNRDRLRAWDFDLQGRSATAVREEARREVIALARAHHDRFGLDLPGRGDPGSDWVVTGHQPELFHPGVWIKNFAAGAISESRSGVGLNLIVDDDIPKLASIRVPARIGDDLRSLNVPFDGSTVDTPFEDWSIRDESIFDQFADRVLDTLGGQVADPTIIDLRRHLAHASAITPLAGLRFAAARRALEADWGVRNWEVTLGSVCETGAFAWFVAHVLAHLDRFREVHNAALDDYRALYKIRSRNHPVPALASEAGWQEAPFWIWRTADPRRRPLLVRGNGAKVELRIPGEDAPFASFSLGPDRDGCCAAEAIRDLPASGIRLRTRALTTTMFARFFLGDLFLHGIGGAKYDELGDEVSRRFFRFEPPRYLTLSLTLWPGVDGGEATPEDLAQINGRIRDLDHNPDRHLGRSTDPAVAALILAKKAAIDGPTGTRRQRVARFHEIRRCNDLLQPEVAAERARWVAGLDRLRPRLRSAAVARSREFSFVVHPADRLRSALRAAVGSA